MLSLKESFLKSLIGLLPLSTAALILSILFGDTSYLGNSQRHLFEVTGTQHLLAASGYNVGMVSTGVSLLVHRFPKKIKLLLMLFSIWLYAVYAMAGASILRATIMHTQALVAEYWHLPYSPRWGLLVTAYLMLALRPAYLLDVGFQLSVVATASIIWGCSTTLSDHSPWKGWVTAAGALPGAPLNSTPSWFTSLKTYWQDSLKVSLWAMGGTLPLVLYHFGESSLWGVIATGLVAWLIPPIMVSGFIVGGLSLFWEMTVISSGLHALVTLFVFLLSAVTYLPPLQIVAQLSWWQVGGCWLVVYAWYVWKGKRNS